MNKHFRLTHAVIASTLFIAPMVHAAPLVVSTVLPPNRDTKTSVDEPITIQSGGQLSMTLAAPNLGDAILVDSDNAVITIDAGNVNAGNNAIVTSVLGRYGINIANGVTGKNALINLGSGSSITSGTNDGIFIDNTGATLISAGKIQGAISAIEISPNGTNATLSLGAGSTELGGTGPTIKVNGTGLSLGNAGTIQSTTAQDTVSILKSFSNFTNNAGGVIQNTGTANAINLNNLGGSGDINNAGIITVSGIGSAIAISSTMNGSIINKSTGTISSTGGNVASSAIKVVAGFSKIDNSGAISSVTNSPAINITANASGTINNNSTGTIINANASAILLNGNITQITNAGIIRNNSAGNGTIDVTAAGVNLIGGISNTGTIENLGAGNALNLALGDNIVLTQSAGAINGNVLLAQNSAAGTILAMSGGTITGNVTGNNVAPNTYALSGGQINGNLTLGSMGDTVNITGTFVNTIIGGAGADIINESGGAGGFLNLFAGATDTLNISDSRVATPTTNVTVGTINLLNPATVVNNSSNVITNLLTLAPGTSLTNNAAVNIGAGGIQNNGYLNTYADINTPSVTNTGTFIIQNPSTTTVVGLFDNTGNLTIGDTGQLTTGSYHQSVTGTFAPNINSSSNGNIQTGTVTGALLEGAIAPSVTPGAFIQTGSTYDIINSGAAFNDATILINPSLLTVYFTKSQAAGNTILRLTAGRNSFSSFASTQPGFGAAAELDNIANQGTTNPTLLQLLGQLDLLTSSAELNDAFISLSPTVNYALVQGSGVSIDNAFNSILFRIETMKNLKPIGAEDYTIYRPEQRNYYSGQNYGDCSDNANATGVWFKVYGTYLNQQFYKNLNGYLGDSVGYAIGSDWGSLDTAVVGLALSYTNTHTVGSSEQANILNIQSVQGTAYAWLEPMESMWMDIMFGFASHKYISRRNIGIGTLNTAAFADFYGIQYAVQSDLGYAFTYDNIIVSPMGRFKYSYLGVDSYTEDGAAGINLSVENNSLQALVGGIGLKILGHKEFSQARYIPEASIMILYDFDASGQETSSNFIGGGGLFPTTGPNPSHAFYQLGAGITAYTYDNYSFAFKYELEVRDRYHFYSNNAYMQLRGEWG